MNHERQLYRSGLAWGLNQCLFPLKMVVPQPLVARVPWLTTNEDIRVGLVLARVSGRLLDVGCGRNRLVKLYREAGGEGHGVDVYPWQGVDEVVKDTANLPYEAASFDTVTFVACLNHIPNCADVLAEAHRLLAPEGRLILTNLRPLVSRVWHAWAFWDADQHERGMENGEVWGFEPAELRALLDAASLRVVDRTRFSWGLNELYVCEKGGR